MGGNISIAYRMSGLVCFSFCLHKCLACEIQSLGAVARSIPTEGPHMALSGG